MCRWMAWLGQPLVLETLLFQAPHGIVDQSLHARMGAEPTNGDGFGIGWYGIGDGPGAIGSPVKELNCHPFSHGRRLFVHNGYINEFHQWRRDAMMALDPELFAAVQGTTDTEVVFGLALTFGLEQDPIAALERTVGFIEELARKRGIEDPVQASFGVSDGESLWAVRYASGGSARSLFVSADPETIRHLHPENPRLARLSPDDRLVVSEPFSDLPGVWDPVPESTALTVRRGGVLETRSFAPKPDELV